jgi:hypothetical protein
MSARTSASDAGASGWRDLERDAFCEAPCTRCHAGGGVLQRSAPSGCMEPLRRLASVPLPVSVTGVAALHRPLPCASLRPPPALYTPQGSCRHARPQHRQSTDQHTAHTWRQHRRRQQHNSTPLDKKHHECRITAKGWCSQCIYTHQRPRAVVRTEQPRRDWRTETPRTGRRPAPPPPSPPPFLGCGAKRAPSGGKTHPFTASSPASTCAASSFPTL